MRAVILVFLVACGGRPEPVKASAGATPPSTTSVHVDHGWFCGPTTTGRACYESAGLCTSALTGGGCELRDVATCGAIGAGDDALTNCYELAADCAAAQDAARRAGSPIAQPCRSMITNVEIQSQTRVKNGMKVLLVAERPSCYTDGEGNRFCGRNEQHCRDRKLEYKHDGTCMVVDSAACYLARSAQRTDTYCFSHESSCKMESAQHIGSEPCFILRYLH